MENIYEFFKRHSLLCFSVNYGRKKICEIDPWLNLLPLDAPWLLISNLKQVKSENSIE